MVFNRNGIAGNYAPQIAEALEKQKLRMEAAARAYHEHKELEAKRKREVITDEISHSASKRQRVEEPQIGSGPTGGDVNGLGGAAAFRDASQDDSRANPLASFDVTTLPVQLVIELIIANLQALTDADLHGAISVS